MNPDVYFYKETITGVELYLGELTTLNGLYCLDPRYEACITSFGASSFQSFGWATEKELPELKTVADITSFFESEGEIGLIEFEATIQDVGILSSHNDRECHFKFTEAKQYLSILKKAAPLEYAMLIFNKLIENPNCYLKFDEFGTMTKYQSFQKYLENDFAHK